MRVDAAGEQRLFDELAGASTPRRREAAEAAIVAAYARFGRWLVRALLPARVPTDEADALVPEATLRALRTYDRDRGRFTTHLRWELCSAARDLARLYSPREVAAEADAPDREPVDLAASVRRLEPLGRREREVLVDAVAGLTVRESAEARGLSVHQVAYYRDAARRAIRRRPSAPAPRVDAARLEVALATFNRRRRALLGDHGEA